MCGRRWGGRGQKWKKAERQLEDIVVLVKRWPISEWTCTKWSALGYVWRWSSQYLTEWILGVKRERQTNRQRDRDPGWCLGFEGIFEWLVVLFSKMGRMMKSNQFGGKTKRSKLDILSPWTSVLLSFPESCPRGWGGGGGGALYDWESFLKVPGQLWGIITSGKPQPQCRGWTSDFWSPSCFWSPVCYSTIDEARTE